MNFEIRTDAVGDEDESMVVAGGKEGSGGEW